MYKPSKARKRLLRNHDTLVQWFQHALDVFVVLSLFVTFTAIFGKLGDPYYRMLGAFTIILMVISHNYFGVHRFVNSTWRHIKNLATAWFFIIFALSFIVVISASYEQYSLGLIVYWLSYSFLVLTLTQTITSKLYKEYSQKYRFKLPALIIGESDIGLHLAKSIQSNFWLRDKVIGILSFDENVEIKNHSVHYLGNLSSLEKVIDEHNIRRIYLTPSFDKTAEIEKIQAILAEKNHIDLVWAPDIFSLTLLNHSVREISGVPLVALNETPLMFGGPAFLKMLMDKSIATAMIIFFFPIFVLVALAVKLTSKGPIFFKQVRDGWDGRKFNVYKFRSMYVHESEKLVKQATKGDSRITPVGAFIRKTSLDELPQLFNILGGTMSLVGPRPHAESHNQYYLDKVKTYPARHRIKPGMTGLAQIYGYRGETKTIEAMEKRVELDIEYIRDWSPMLDLKILLLTPLALISKNTNAY
jgi:putative colanic acid biosynthesis UDP-glucose lipid carrier transferase